MTARVTIEEQVERDTLDSVLPVRSEQRVWGFWDFTMVTVGLAIATWCFLIGGTCASFVNLKMGTAAILAGNTVAVLLMALSSTMPSYRYGVELFLLLRAVFGTRGTLIPLTLAQIIWIGWSAVLMVMFGRVCANVLAAAWPLSAVGEARVTVVAALAGMTVCWIVLMRGVAWIQQLNRFVAPGLALIMIWLSITIVRDLGVAELLALRPAAPNADRWQNYMLVFELNLGAGFGWWPFMGGLARLVKTPRAAFWPNLIGLSLFASLGTIVGLIGGLRFGSSDPTRWIMPLAGATAGSIILAFIGLGNITATVLTDYVACLSLKQLPGVGALRWRTVTTLFAVPCTVLIFFADRLYDSFGSLLAITGTLMAPLAGIYLVDYLLIRRKTIRLADLYDMSRGGAYYYSGGFNVTAIASVVMATAVYFWIFNPLTFAASAVFRGASASLPALAVGAAVYSVLMARRAGVSRRLEE